MKVTDPGHSYLLDCIDGGQPKPLVFVKRCDPENPEKYPGNENAYPGTTMQNVLRALLDRLRYLQNQVWSLENSIIIGMLKVSLWLLEYRAARRHGKSYWRSLRFSECAQMCGIFGHTQCDHRKEFYAEIR